jgi:hypothetical protein
MALLDICLSEGDSQISQEESRGNVGVLTDECANSQISVEIPSTGTSDYEVGFGYAS